MTIWTDLADLEFKNYYVDANGIKTRVLEAGTGEPLILLHGTGGHIEAHARNIRGLSEHFRVICIDMLGHGYTEKPDRPYGIDSYSDHLLWVIQALDLKEVYLSGESLGGWVAAWFAAHHPGIAKALVLNTPGNVNNKAEVMKKLKESTVKAVLEANYENVKTRLEWLMYDKSQVTDELIEARYKIYTQPSYQEAVHHIVALQDIEYRQNYSWDPSWCEKIDVPTLLAWTDHDPTSTVEEAKPIQEMIPGSELTVINDAGHWPQWEKAEEFNKVIIDFFSKIPVK
ncbi:alpha/beta fold hydrolase [Peribacillus castrilensis]|uniref:Alpha/beta hydrolase fold protein n=1 Tax=Peribacillus simplex TaxID=1478 RepID=A0AAN2PB54_9BACI|nr:MULTISPECIES: alpha/beta hydrolase [Bacillaceae]MCP1094527.1 alpha/beta hydrolase [Bacillaceae bacterium OS4b]CRH65927.1 2-hydroxy-6-oxo-6-phenylhexa-2%2C4-dienoate hydrolase [Chlamydia trachomatis]MBD8588361.1 alpha/beta hydrolase [Peribacillus simplex]MCF7620505.1 alpha/beta hydrolase [Peribacillus frigoritolerans]MCP1151163.1 alpha/beta hydrolase [Peribacillus frigoritolerans]